MFAETSAETSATGFAATPDPPYWAVIFTTTQTTDLDGYAETAARMEALAGRMPGFLGIESARTPDGVGITVSYWDSEAAVAAWRDHPEHVAARASGRDRWYERYELRVARVERSYRWP